MGDRLREGHRAVAQIVGRRALLLAGVLLLVGTAASCGSGPKSVAALITRLPVRACATSNGIAPSTAVTPGYLPRSVPLPAGLDQADAAKLSWYEGDIRKGPDLKTLAPRGFHCSAGIGADGNETLTVTGSRKQSVTAFAYDFGNASQIACPYFSSALAVIPGPSNCQAPHGTTVRQLNPHLVRITTPAGHGKPASHQLLYWYATGGGSASGVDCVLTSGSTVCPAILAEARTRLARQFASAAKAMARLKKKLAKSPGTLVATITGSGNVCLLNVSTGLTAAPTAADSYDLRRPGNGVSEGQVIAVPAHVQANRGGCSVQLVFRVLRSLGFFVVYDETDGVYWGPFDSHNLQSSGWALTLAFKGS